MLADEFSTAEMLAIETKYHEMGKKYICCDITDLHPAQLAQTALYAPAGRRSASSVETFKMPIKLLA